VDLGNREAPRQYGRRTYYNGKGKIEIPNITADLAGPVMAKAVEVGNSGRGAGCLRRSARICKKGTTSLLLGHVNCEGKWGNATT